MNKTFNTGRNTYRILANNLGYGLPMIFIPICLVFGGSIIVVLFGIFTGADWVNGDIPIMAIPMLFAIVIASIAGIVITIRTRIIVTRDDGPIISESEKTRLCEMQKNFTIDAQLPYSRNADFYYNIPILPEGEFVRGKIVEIRDGICFIRGYYNKKSALSLKVEFTDGSSHRVGEEFFVQYYNFRYSKNHSASHMRLISCEAMLADNYDHNVLWR